MQTQCSAASFGFQAVEGRSAVASFDGGRLSSDAGALLLGEMDRAVADLGFARDPPMAWREANGVDYLFGLAKNRRLAREVETELAQARAHSMRTGKPPGCACGSPPWLIPSSL